MRYTARTVYTLAGEPIENGYVAVSPLGNDHIDYDHMEDAKEIVKSSVV